MNSNSQPVWPTPEQADLLRSTMVRLIPACEEVSTNFYDRLFAMHPSLRPLFPEDMEMQKEKLIMMLASSIDLVGDPEGFEKACEELGARHIKYGAEAAHYPIVATLALEELGRASNPPFTAAESEAWNLLFDLIGTAMLNGAARTESAPPQA
ncbi:MAG TPA: globin domain-containing protein [Fimbriimonas sp.]|nr:globin domain-containing protein [Fimbriimonas sp.]